MNSNTDKFATQYGVDYSLNNVQMEKICNCPVYTYTELATKKSLEALFEYNGKPNDKVVICFLTRANYGHWCCLYKNSYGIGFFDSYGYKPDDELDWNIDEYFRVQAGEDYPHLTWLLYDYTLRTGQPINYNQYKFQSKDKNVATCGRWTIVRLSLKFLSDIEYRDVISTCSQKTNLTPDMLVVALTNPALNQVS